MKYGEEFTHALKSGQESSHRRSMNIVTETLHCSKDE